MSTQALSGSVILFVSSGPAGAPEGGHQMVCGVKKKKKKKKKALTFC